MVMTELTAERRATCIESRQMGEITKHLKLLLTSRTPTPPKKGANKKKKRAAESKKYKFSITSTETKLLKK